MAFELLAKLGFGPSHGHPNQQAGHGGAFVNNQLYGGLAPLSFGIHPVPHTQELIARDLGPLPRARFRWPQLLDHTPIRTRGQKH